MSRRDGAIVAWHEVPGTAPPQKSRPFVPESCSCSSSCSLSSFDRCWVKSGSLLPDVNEDKRRMLCADIQAIDNDHEHDNEHD